MYVCGEAVGGKGNLVGLTPLPVESDAVLGRQRLLLGKHVLLHPRTLETRVRTPLIMKER